MATTTQTVPEPVLRLPDDPSSVQLRNQARDLQRGVRAGTASALDLLVAALPDRVPDPGERTRFALSTAQLAIAGPTDFPAGRSCARIST